MAKTKERDLLDLMDRWREVLDEMEASAGHTVSLVDLDERLERLEGFVSNTAQAIVRMRGAVDEIRSVVDKLLNAKKLSEERKSNFRQH